MLKALMPLLSAMAGEELKFVAGQTKRAAIFGAAIAVFAIIAITFSASPPFWHWRRTMAAAGGSHSRCIVADRGASHSRSPENSGCVRGQKRKQKMEADKSAMVAAAAIATVPAILKRPILAAALPLAGIALVSLLSDKKSARRRADSFKQTQNVGFKPAFCFPPSPPALFANRHFAFFG